LLFLVGKYAATYIGIADSLETAWPSIGLMKWAHLFEQFAAAAVKTLWQLMYIVRKKINSPVCLKLNYLDQRFPNCGPRTTGGRRFLRLWSS
jgi:hypothetical protein